MFFVPLFKKIGSIELISNSNSSSKLNLAKRYLDGMVRITLNVLSQLLGVGGRKKKIHFLVGQHEVAQISTSWVE
jgi:hypothetical protein